MAKAKRKELLSSAPWRGGGEESSDGDKFKDAKIKVTSNPGSTPTMHVPSKKKFSSADDDSLSEIDAELRYSFQRNFQFLQRVFSIDTIVKPLPPVMAYNVSRNLSFFTRIFTQFFGKSIISRAPSPIPTLRRVSLDWMHLVSFHVYNLKFDKWGALYI
ncbi:hypothetical protein CsSME_00048456 [Camellia sinensis var. sinensis]